VSKLECAVGLVGLPATLPLPLTLGESSLAEYLKTASAAAAGPAIDFTLLAPQTVGPKFAKTVSALDLHEATATLAANPASGKQVGRVVLLFARRYGPRHSLFGVMFDRGFKTKDDPNKASSFTRFPRQGCAVFVDAIADYRKAGVERDTEIAFTALHELGHLFNLGHVRKPSSFMSDAESMVPPPSSFGFTPRHCERLRLGSTSPHVWPGGSRYGDLGPLSPDPAEEHGAPSRFGLELAVEVCQREFNAWEPVELEIQLSVAPGLDRSFVLPDVVDPGYGAFEIWIERPNRERVRYRPCNVYCRNPGKLEIAPGQSFDRDLSLFGQSGGYTFRHAGVHRVWAELRLPRLGLLTSNVVELNVLPQPYRGPRLQLGTLLDAPAAARALFYRASRPGGRGATRLEQVAADFAATPAAAASHYTLGRILLGEAERRRSAEVGSRLRAEGRERLARAAQHQRLSRHRRRVAERLLDGEARER
jgi:hypothetical protein